MNVFHQIATLSFVVLMLSDAYVCQLIVPQNRDQSLSAYPENLYIKNKLNLFDRDDNRYSDETRKYKKSSMHDKNWQSTSNENYKSLSTTKKYHKLYDDSIIANPSK